MNSISVDTQVNLKDIEKEIDSINRDLKTGQDKVDFSEKWEKAKNRLMKIRGTLQEQRSVGYHNLNVLQKDSSGRLQKAKQISSNEMTKIKMIINGIDSTLSHYTTISQKASGLNTTLTDSFHDFEEDYIVMNKSEEKDPLQVTYQTIALLDAVRYGTTTGSESVEKYPSPDLGQPSGQRNCCVADKIRMGSANSAPSGSGDYRITIPEFCRNFHGRDI